MIPKTYTLKKKPKKIKISEHHIQAAFFKQVSIDPFFKKYRPVIFAVPNGGHRNVIVATNLKREGVTAGVLDVFVAIPSGKYHGLWCEFKSGKNKLTEAQEKFRMAVLLQGYEVIVCYSSEAAITGLRNYLFQS